MSDERRAQQRRARVRSVVVRVVVALVALVLLQVAIELGWVERSPIVSGLFGGLIVALLFAFPVGRSPD